MIEMSFSDVSRAVGTNVLDAGGDGTVRRVVIDSRVVAPGDLFVAVRGDRFDGHDFVAQSVARGAVACIVEAGRGAGAVSGTPRWEVCDTVVTLGRLAAHFRRHVIPSTTTVVGVTGSNGKTTTKSMLHHVLSSAMPGRASPRSFNNAIGVPLTLLSCEPGDRYLIAEIGTNAPGEVGALAEMVAPDVGVITSVGEAHLEGLGTLAAIAAEKASLLRHVRTGGVGVVNVDEPELVRRLHVPDGVELVTVGRAASADVVVRSVSSSLTETVVAIDGQHRVTIGMPGDYHAGNVGIVVTVARHLGVNLARATEALRSFVPQTGRTQVIEHQGMIIVDDSYNANPSSMTAAIDALSGVPLRRRVMVMGDMWELGTQRHERHRVMVDRAVAGGIEVVVLVGPTFGEVAADDAARWTGSAPICFADAAVAGAALPMILRPGDCVWVKGSRAVGLDQTIDSLRQPTSGDVPVA